VKEAVAEEVSLVDGDNGMAAALGEIREGSAEAFAEAARVEVGADAESGEEIGEEGLDGEVGIGDVSGEVEVLVKGLDKGADGGRFAGADLAGDERRERVLESESQAGLDFLVGGGREEIAAREGFVEGEARAAEEIAQSLRHEITPEKGQPGLRAGG
jgi:hypothetical protein